MVRQLLRRGLPRAGDDRVVDRQHWPSTYDRDLDVQRQRTPDPIEPIDRYRRLVANPLLAMERMRTQWPDVKWRGRHFTEL